jgi:uncharacterized MnhB-related membrane protein
VSDATVTLGFMLGMAVVVVFARRMMTALLGLSLFSMLLTLMYVLLHAPDVALTEAALGVGLSPLVFLIAIRKIGDDRDD